MKIIPDIYSIESAYKQILEQCQGGDPQILATLMLTDVISQLPTAFASVLDDQNYRRKESASELITKLDEVRQSLDYMSDRFQNLLDLMQKPV